MAEGMERNTGSSMGIRHNLLLCGTVYHEEQLFSNLAISTLFEIALIVSGAGIHRVIDKDIPCKSGDIFVIPPNVPHGYFLEEENSELVVRQLFFDVGYWFSGEVADKTSIRYCYGIFRENPMLGYAVLNRSVMERICSLFAYIGDELAEQKDECAEVIKGILSAILINISRYINSAVKDVSFASCEEWNPVLDAIKIINEEYCDTGLTRADVAERVYISESHFGRTFKKLTGKFFAEYLRDVRLKTVCRLLKKSDASIEHIARECGFRDMPSFYKNFNAKMHMTPKEYRQQMIQADNRSDEYIKLLKGEKIMGVLNDISTNLQQGKAKAVKDLVQQALDEGVKPADILNEGLLDGMSVIGEKFKNNEVYVPQVLIAARAMNMGMQCLKPCLAAEGIKAKGRVCIGTVQGDLHDIGKNLVKMMMEGKGLEVIDLGTDVAPEKFVETAIEQNCQVICCSSLLTTTMPVMKDVIKVAEKANIRSKVKIMIGGAPVNEEFCQKIGADCYTDDAASAADAAVTFCSADEE